MRRELAKNTRQIAERVANFRGVAELEATTKHGVEPNFGLLHIIAELETGLICETQLHAHIASESPQ
jgi:hypothetical protein